MSRSEFRYNKKRKHYSYLFKDNGLYRKNLILSTKPYIKKKKKNGKIKIFNNVPLYRHPNPKDNTKLYVDKRVYNDHINSFDSKKEDSWKFDINDKRKIKRLKQKK